MTILASNLIIILISFCFLNKETMLSIGYKLLAFFLVLTVIRFLLPFEFPFTERIILPETISKYLFFFQHPFYQNGFIMISFWWLCECVWFIGCFLGLYKHIRDYRRSARFIAAHGHEISLKEPVNSILNNICGNRKNPFRVIVMSTVDIPQVFGIFSPRILIPDYMDLNSEEFYYTLRHETYHYFHHDLLIKEAVSLLGILYWWNPFCILFKRQVSLLLEMHVDDSLVNENPDTARAYMRSLINIADSAATRHDSSSVSSSSTVAMFNDDNKQLYRRFQMLGHQNNRYRIPLFLSFLMLVSFIYLCSFGFILEARYNEINPTEPGDLQISDGLYVIPKKDGTYDLYFNELFIENLENLDHYPDIPIIEEQ